MVKRRLPWLMGPPLCALILVFVTRKGPMDLPFEVDGPSLDAPPDAACEELFHLSLERMHEGVEAVGEVRTRILPTVVSGPSRPESRDRAAADVDWHARVRRASFVDAFLNAPPGVPAGDLHRCQDLNPEDRYLEPHVRESIERAVEPYYRALEHARLVRDRALSEGMADARAAGLARQEVVPERDGQSLSVTLQPSPVRTMSVVEVAADGRAISSTVEAVAMPRFLYMDSLHWFVAREAGAQIVSIYAAFGLLPSLNAESMTRRIVAECGKRIR
jgi:hypothetical protein